MNCPCCKSEDVENNGSEPALYACNDCGCRWDEDRRASPSPAKIGADNAFDAIARDRRASTDFTVEPRGLDGGPVHVPTAAKIGAEVQEAELKRLRLLYAAVDQQLVSAGIWRKELESDPEKALRDLIAWNCGVQEYFDKAEFHPPTAQPDAVKLLRELLAGLARNGCWREHGAVSTWLASYDAQQEEKKS